MTATLRKDHLGLCYERGNTGWRVISRDRYVRLLAAGATVWGGDDVAFKRAMDAELDAHLERQYLNGSVGEWKQQAN